MKTIEELKYSIVDINYITQNMIREGIKSDLTLFTDLQINEYGTKKS